jgi:hypothetical protein
VPDEARWLARACFWVGRCYLQWVMKRKARFEHIWSGPPPRFDVGTECKSAYGERLARGWSGIAPHRSSDPSGSVVPTTFRLDSLSGCCFSVGTLSRVDHVIAR